MTGDAGRHSFWTTLPGILTGLAAVLTAVTGLIVGISQFGWLGSRADPAQPGAAQGAVAAERSEARRPAGRDAAAVPQPASPAAEPAAPPPAEPAAKEATVVITAQDGTTTTVYADSFQHRQQGRELHLLNGQRIPFDRIRALDVARVEADRARVNITLVNGTVYSGYISSGLYPFGFYGTNDLGTFEINVDKLARFTFER